MYKTITLHDFNKAFVDMGRENNFTYEARQAFFEYLEQLEQDTGTPIELDVIALCCEYTEYKDLQEYNENYNTSHKHTYQVADDTAYIPIPNTERFIIANY